LLDRDYNHIIQHYNKLYSKYGYSHKSIGWGKKRHYLRYYILLSEFELDNKSLLDFGCGFGDLYRYVIENFYGIDYEGIDINQNLVKEGIKQNPGIKLYCFDAINEGLKRKYDYIISSGVHNTKISNNWDFIVKTFELFNKNSVYGFAINFLSNNVDYKEDNLFYTDPGKILNLGLNFSNKVKIKHDYMPYEYTIFVKKHDSVNEDNNVFNEYIEKL